ncbi:MAG: hypothetical protein LUH63_20475 [Parabacteroides sp.]|nr:hypothetical protein [Parabacteroides sp.]
MGLMTDAFARKGMEVQRKFFNKMQRMGMAIAAHDEYWVCSRGTGKSEGLDARFILRNVWAMPGSTGALISPSYAKAWGTRFRLLSMRWPNGDIRKAFIFMSAAKPRSQLISESLNDCRSAMHGIIAFIFGMER